jgi:hypothetical protein
MRILPLLLLFACSPLVPTKSLASGLDEYTFANWITADPKSQITEFERGCRAVEAYLNSRNKEFYGEDCISNLYIAAVFIADTNNYYDAKSLEEDRRLPQRQAAQQRYTRVLEEVVAKAVREGRAETEEQQINLLYTVIVTVQKDLVADYYHNVFDDPNEAKSAYLLAGVEDGRRIYGEGSAKLYLEKENSSQASPAEVSAGGKATPSD